MLYYLSNHNLSTINYCSNCSSISKTHWFCHGFGDIFAVQNRQIEICGGYGFNHSLSCLPNRFLEPRHHLWSMILLWEMIPWWMHFRPMRKFLLRIYRQFLWIRTLPLTEVLSRKFLVILQINFCYLGCLTSNVSM